MELLTDCLGGGVAVALAMTWIYGVLRLIEMVLPNTHVTAASQLRALKYWPFYIIALVTFGRVSQIFLDGFSSGSIITLGGYSLYEATGLGILNYLIWPVVGLIILDFFHYWKHRAQHRFFWRFHAVHHSIENLSAVNSYHHWTDPAFGIAFVAIPMFYLVGIDFPTFAIVTTIISMQGAFIHSNSRFHLGVFNRIIVDNRFHRIHHSIEKRHYGLNFGERTSIWDQLFGTAYFPAHDEWPVTGTTEDCEPRNTSDYFLRPFKRRTHL